MTTTDDRPEFTCPSWCTAVHEPPAVSVHGEWYLTHRSDPVGIFLMTDGESSEEQLGSVSTSSDVCNLPERDELRRIVLDMRTDCWGEAWLTPEQADVLAQHLRAAADSMRADQ